MSSLAAALALAARGFHVFPIEPGRKAPPYIDDFPNKATRDAGQITRWWTCPVLGFEQDFNIGVSTSRFGDDEALIAVDIDNKGEVIGDDTIAALAPKGKILPDTCEVFTPTGGRHLIYRSTVAVRQGAGVLGPGVDIRSSGGYVVGAGSRVGSGQYTGGVDAPAPAPDWLIAACGAAGSPAAATVRTPPGASHAAINENRARERALRYLNSQPEVTEGERNHKCFLVANHLKDLGLDEPTCFDLMHEWWACSPSLDDAELAVAIGSAYRSTRTVQGSAAPEVEFAPPRVWFVESLIDFCRIRE